MQQRRFELHLPGLLKVLAEHLYSSKKVGVRELIQNAHDSCTRRKLEENDKDYSPRITISLNPKQRTLTIMDNGSGMTADEITTYLATIGRGYTGEMRERLSMFGGAEASELIGQFGLGFLSAFLLAEDVKVTTQSYRGGPALLWHSAGDENYELTETTKAAVGTSVTLRVKPAASFILQKEMLIETVRAYADFLPVPSYWQYDDEPINLMQAPWEADNPIDAANEFITRVFHDRNPLWIMPLKDAKVAAGHDTITVPMNGFLYVPAGSTLSVREYGEMRVYIRRMFICDKQEHLLPPWARFVRGVIDCPALQPTASREDLHQDDHFEAVQQALEDQLSKGLRQLAKEDPARWKHLVRMHSEVIVGWAVKDSEFFKQVKDIVVLRTSRGMLTVPEYLEHTDGSLYYVTRELGSLQEQMLAEGRNVPAIDAAWGFVAPFLEKYAALHRQVKLVQLDGETETLLRPANEKIFAGLLVYFEKEGISAEAAAFAPKEVPALVVYPPDAELLHDSQASLKSDDLPASMTPLVQAFVNDKLAEPTNWQGKLYLNASCPYIKELAKKPAGPTRDAALKLLHQVARLFAGRMLNAADAAGAFSKLTAALKELA